MRIAPNEVCDYFTFKSIFELTFRVQIHFAKPSAYHEIYNQKNRWDRDMKLYHLFADEVSTLTIPDYARAKKRRDITAPIFSRKNVLEMQHLIQRCVRTVSWGTKAWLTRSQTAKCNLRKHRQTYPARQSFRYLQGLPLLCGGCHLYYVLRA